MLMAVIMLATSVGITAKVHYCFMEKETATVTNEKGCCNNHELKSCCETKDSNSFADNLITNKGCCSDQIKSFSFATTFVNKIVSLQLTQFVTLLSYAVLYHFSDVEVQHSFETATIFNPPKLYGTALLCFKQVLNL